LPDALSPVSESVVSTPVLACGRLPGEDVVVGEEEEGEEEEEEEEEEEGYVLMEEAG
jgi:hypothetical protein